MFGVGYGFWWVFDGRFGVVVVIVVLWKRERYDGLGFGFCLGIRFEFWFRYWILFGFESATMVVVGGATGLLDNGGGWLRERERERERERNRKRNKDEEREVR